MLCCVVLCCVVLCCVVLCCVVLCCVALCCVALRCVVLCCSAFNFLWRRPSDYAQAALHALAGTSAPPNSHTPSTSSPVDSLDDHIPAGPGVQWVQCTRCLQWASVERGCSVTTPWTCAMNEWNPGIAVCMSGIHGFCLSILYAPPPPHGRRKEKADAWGHCSKQFINLMDRNPAPRGGGRHAGLLQIDDVHKTNCRKAYKFRKNVAFAKEKYEECTARLH